jgi:hypothetical protein
MTSVTAIFGEGAAALHRTVRVEHRVFPNGGGWSFFTCPECGLPARILRLYEKPMCQRCCGRRGARYRSAYGWSRLERAKQRNRRIEQLRAQLQGGPVRLKPRPGRVLDRRRDLQISLRRGLVVKRLDMLQRWRAGKLLH